MSMRKYYVPALEKGLDVLETLAGSSTPLSLTVLAGRLDRSANELFRMLACLEQRGYIVRDAGDSAYSLSLKLYELAHTHSPFEKLVRAAEAPMREFSESTGESCHLSTVRDGQLVILAQSESPRPVRLSVELGGRFAPDGTASGRLLLAHQPSAKTHALKSQLAKIRREGVVVARDESLVGVHDAAVLVGNPEVGVSAALAVSWLAAPRSRSRRNKLVTALHRCARAINQSVGLNP